MASSFNYESIIAVENDLRIKFTGYKIKMVASHLTEIKVKNRYLLSYKSFLGITYKRNYSYSDEVIKMEVESNWKKRMFSAPTHEYEVYVGIDEHRKVVYWNYKDFRRIKY